MPRHGADDGVESPISILVIESDPADELALTQAVADERLGYQLVFARSVSEARGRLAAHAFDVVLAGDSLPDGTASDLIDALSAQAVVFLATGGDEETAAARALQLGIENSLAKDPGRQYLRLLPYRVETARRQSRRARQLRESEARFRALSETIPQQVWTARPNGDLDYVNGRVLDYSWRTRDEMLGGGWEPIVHPDDVPAYRQRWWQSLKTGEPFEIEYRLKVGGHEIYRWHLGRALPFRRETGEIVKWFGTNTDITERKLTEQVREASEFRLRAILDATPVPIVLNDAQQNLTFVNPAFVATFGYSLDDVPTLADWIAKAFPDPQYARWVGTHWLKAAGSFAEAGLPLPELEIEVRCKDGTAVIVQAQVTTLAHSLAGSQLAVFVDVTARRQAENALRQNQLRLRGILDSLFVFVGLCSLEGVVVDVNRAPFFAGGLRREDVIGQAIWDTPRWNHSASSRDRLRDAVRRAGLGEVVRGDFEVRLEGGEIGWVDATFGPLCDEAGQILHIVASGTEVTERVRVGQALQDERDRLARIAASVPGAIFSFRLRPDGTTCFPYASPTIEKIWGLQPNALEADSSPIFALVHPADLALLRRGMAESARTLLPWYHRFRVRHPQRSEIWVESHAVPVADPGGDITWHGVITDITLRKHEEMAHEKLRIQMQHAQKLEAVGQLAGGVAHDFNNLLTVINGRAEFGLQQARAGDPMRKTLFQIHDAGARAAALTQHLLSVSGNQVTHPVVLNLHRLIVSMQGLLEHLLGETIALVMEPAPAKGYIRADRLQIEQLILNLCVNARDAMLGGGTLTIDVRDLDIDEVLAAERPPVALGPHVELAVRDTGVGMDGTVRERIFEPFFTTKPLGKGSGLGLAVVYRTVQHIGGSLSVDTAPGEGTTFRIYLPRVEEAREKMSERLAEPGLDRDETILVVDDEVEVGDLARDILELAGYTVLTAVSGEDALAVLARRDRPVHVVLSDVTMQGMSGVALKTILARERPEIRVLLTSGFSDDSVLRGHDGMDAAIPFLGKPYSATALRRAVRELLDAQRHDFQGGTGSRPAGQAD